MTSITLLDLMMLAAATALGLAVARLGWARAVAGAGAFDLAAWSVNASGYPSKAWVLPIAGRVAPFLPCLAAWTGAFLLTRLRIPRPRRRRLLAQPGFVAALSVLSAESALLIVSAVLDGRFAAISPPRAGEYAANGVILLGHHAGWAVAVSWATLALAGRWRPERSWVDRWGRALGVSWILVGPAASLLIDHAPWWGDFFG